MGKAKYFRGVREAPPDMNDLMGRVDIVLLTLDTLRYDVAARELGAGRTPHFAALFPGGWEKRHTPGSFTYAAHQAFFAGFLPTPADPALRPPRLFATRFEGSETTGPVTKVFEAATIVEGLRGLGYHTACLGGTGFFNRRTPLSRVMPDWFDESHWSPEMSVTGADSTRHQFALAAEILDRCARERRRLFLFVNVSAIHQPNRHHLPGAAADDLDSHAAALRYVDAQLPFFLTALRRKGPCFLIACSDHGTLYGEDGFTGHRVGHELVYTVPYAHALLA